MAPSPPNLYATLLSKKPQNQQKTPQFPVTQTLKNSSDMPLVLLKNLRIIFRGGDTSLSQGFQSYVCKFFIFLLLFFNLVQFSGIEILKIGSVVLWTKYMDQKHPFSFALSIFPSRVCFGICADPEENFSYNLWQDLLTSTRCSIRGTDAFNNRLS